MAVFAVAFDGTRVNAGDVITGWAADGVTPAVNADQFYQGSGSIGAQVKTSDAGFKFVSSAQDMSSRAVLVKVNSGRPGALQGNGISVRIGSTDGSNYHLWSLFSAASYPAVGGWQVVAIDPNVSQWRTSTSGTPNLASVVYWGFRAHYTANTQGANTFADSIDTIASGTGLTGTAGGGGDPAGTFASFVTADANTEANRWGVVLAQNGILFVNGTLTVGSSGTATRFNSIGETLVFPAHKVTTGFCGVKLDAQNASTDIDVTGALFNGRGALSGSDDTRPRLAVVGTSGSATLDGCTFSGFEQLVLTAAATLVGCSVSSSGLITQSGATLSGCTISASTATRAVLSNDPGSISDCTFVSAGTGHAIEITTPGTYTFDGNLFSGYAASDGTTGNEAIYNNSGGSVTLNVVGGGSTPSIRNGAGASTTVNSNVSVTLTGLKNPSEVRVYSAGTTTEIAGQENVTSGTFAFGVGAGVSVDISILSLGYQNMRILSYSTTGDASLPVSQQVDRQYANP